MQTAEESTDKDLTGQAPWSLRPLLLAGLGLATGLLCHWILGSRHEANIEAWRTALLAAVTLGAALVGFTLERKLWWVSIVFSLVTAVVAGLVVFWNGSPGGWGSGEGWRTISLLLAVAIAAPLFQAARDEGARRFPYASVHDHAWTNVVLWCACWLFVAIVLALSWLLASLFDLIKIDLLRRLLEKEWFWRALVGMAFGAGLGLLRENDGVVRLLQRVVATVLAVLAPVLGVGLALFLLALPFTGLQALWDATSATTPILLACVIGALILANAVIGNMPEHERRFPMLRYGAMLLAAVVLPLAIIAAIATGLRIGQYGFTPERLWAVVFVALACLYGAAYLAALILGGLGWAGRARPMNLTLAFVTCGLALLLATPLISFNAISTRDQLARLESGRVTPEKFDWAALAFDFGEPGRAALKRLQASANPAIKARAGEVAKAERRWDVENYKRQAEVRREVVANLRVLPQGASLPGDLRNQIAESASCTGKEKCTLILVAPEEALVFEDQCFATPKPSPSSDERVLKTMELEPFGCGGVHFSLREGKWERGDPSPTITRAQRAALAADYAAGRVEIRTVQRRQAFVGGVPVGRVFE